MRAVRNATRSHERLWTRTATKRHKGIRKGASVAEGDYVKLLQLWDKQYTLKKSVMGYEPHNRDAAKFFREVKYEDDDDEEKVVAADPNGKRKATTKAKKPKKKKKRRLINVTANTEKHFTSRSFCTLQSGVHRTNVSKRLGVTPSDKVIFPRHNFGSYSFGSRFTNVVKEFNKDKTYDELFQDFHLNALCRRENNYLDNEFVRYFSNGVGAKQLLSLDESLDHQVCVEFLLREEFMNERIADAEARSKNETSRLTVATTSVTIDIPLFFLLFRFGKK